MRWIIPALMITVYGVFFTGCSLDSAQIMEHPSQAKTGDSIDVVLANFYVYVTSGSSVLFPASRDSLHMAVSVPSGWAPVSAGYYAAPHLRMLKYLSSTTDTSVLSKALKDSLALYKNRQQPLASDAAMRTAFSGRTITAHDSTNDRSRTIQTDSLTWAAFSGLVNLQIRSGARVDTVISKNDTIRFGDSAITLPDTIPVDSIGVIVIPVFVFTRIRTGSLEGDYTLYYWTKTGALPPRVIDTTNQMASIDKGDMVYYRMTLSRTSPVIRFTNAQNRPGISVFPNPFRHGTTIYLKGKLENISLHVAVYSIDGRYVRGLETTGETVYWDGTDQAGRSVQNGLYFLKSLNTNSDPVQYIRKIE